MQLLEHFDMQHNPMPLQESQRPLHQEVPPNPTPESEGMRE